MSYVATFVELLYSQTTLLLVVGELYTNCVHLLFTHMYHFIASGMCFLHYQDINNNYIIQLMWILQYHLACGSHKCTFDLFITIVDMYGLSVHLFKQPFNWLASLVFFSYVLLPSCSPCSSSQSSASIMQVTQQPTEVYNAPLLLNYA